MKNAAPEDCPHCGSKFEPKRRDQKFCSANCRKRAHQRKDREKNSMTSRKSPADRRETTERIDRLMRITEIYYATSPNYRAGIVKEIVDQARADNMPLRSTLSNRYFLGAQFEERPWLYFRRSWAYPNITKVANAYCRYFWKSGVIDVVMKRAPEPATGEIVQSWGNLASRLILPASESVPSIVVNNNEELKWTKEFRTSAK